MYSSRVTIRDAICLAARKCRRVVGQLRIPFEVKLQNYYAGSRVHLPVAYSLFFVYIPLSLM